MNNTYYDYIIKEIKLKPKNPQLSSNSKQNIECLLCGNTFKAGVKGKVANYKKHNIPGCSKCVKGQQYKTNRENYLKEVEELFTILSEFSIDELIVGKKLKVKNNKCGHVFLARWENLKNKTTHCPVCNTERKRESFQKFNEEKHLESYQLKEGFDGYKQRVYKLTRDNYKTHSKIINPNNYNRTLSGGDGYHLDHIISVRNSFDLNVPPEVCADYRNLRMVRWKNNNNKWKRSSLKIPEPYHPYIKNISNDFIKTVVGNIATKFEEYKDFHTCMLTLYNEDKKFGIYFAQLDTNTEQMLGSRNYFKKMKQYFEDLDITVLIIYEDEWLHNKHMVLQKIQHYLKENKNYRIHARKCVLREISLKEKNTFLNNNHIQGTCVSQINIGAYYDNKLVAVMTFSKPRVLMNRKKLEDDVYELARIATDINYVIPGIVSKMWTYFKNNYNWSEVYSFADIRWSSGNLYERLEFELKTVNPPNYHYIIDGKRKHRWAYRKDALKEKFPDQYDKKLTEYQNMLALGYDRVWDCGSLKYTITNSQHK